MRIIINADDFGWDADTTRATIECFERGSLTSATIMANMPSTAEAAAYARKRPDLSFGAHLTFSSDGFERPLLDPKEIPSLVQSNGEFLGPVPVRSAAVRNRLSVDELEREMTAQLGRLCDQGVALSHVDSHGHLHKYRPFRAALRKALPRFGISRVRTVQDIYLRPPIKSPVFWLGWHWRRALRSHFHTTDHFFMPTTARDQSWIDAVLQMRLGGSALEVGVHPGYQDEWRDAERRACHGFAVAAKRAGHELIGWKDL